MFIIIFLLLATPLALFLHLYFLSSSLPFFNINLLLYLELAIICLGLAWLISSKVISKLFNLDIMDTLKKDLLTYTPLCLLLLYFIDLNSSTDNLFSTPKLLLSIVFLIMLFKISVVLHLKKKKNAYLLTVTGLIMPLMAINFFIIKPKSSQIPRQTLMEKLNNLYNADSLYVFNKKFNGVYKKKIEIDNAIRNALVLLPPKRIETTVNVPAESYLQFGFGIWKLSLENTKGDGIQFNLFLKNKGKIKLVYDKYIDPKHYIDDRKWFDVSIDLRDYANQEITLIFEVLGSQINLPPFESKADNRDDYAAISDPQIILYKPTKNTTTPNIILISLDTLRADHLRCYGYKRKDISPNIDRLAENGILFEKAISQASWTLPSHMSIFTSLISPFHNVKVLNQRLSENIITLPEILKSNGYKTTAFSSSVSIDGVFGFCKGFDVYRNDSFTTDPTFHELKQWLETNRSQKFFLFLHTYRIHAPYTDFLYADEVLSKTEIDELKRFAKHSGTSPEISLIHAHMEKLKEMQIYTKEVVKNFYDGGIKATDKYIGKLMEVIEETGLSNNTIIVLTSDHGEEFADHSSSALYNKHGQSLYDEVLHVPLIFRIPGNLLPVNLLKGKRIKPQTRLIDIMPTILDLANIKYNVPNIQGISLLPFMRGDEVRNKLTAFSEVVFFAADPNLERHHENAGSLMSIRSNKFKYITNLHNNVELYNLTSDPGEKHNVSAFEPKLSQKLAKEIKKTIEAAKHFTSEKESLKGSTLLKLDKEKEKQLKALGYIQ